MTRLYAPISVTNTAKYGERKSEKTSWALKSVNQNNPFKIYPEIAANNRPTRSRGAQNEYSEIAFRHINSTSRPILLSERRLRSGKFLNSSLHPDPIPCYYPEKYRGPCPFPLSSFYYCVVQTLSRPKSGKPHYLPVKYFQR